MFVLSRSETSALDRYLFTQMGIPRAVVIERAGLAVAGFCVDFLKINKLEFDRIDVFFGKGLNGVDALCCARELFSKGFNVKLWDVFPGNEMPDDLKWIVTACQTSGMLIRPAQEFDSSSRSLIIDGIFGTSFDIKRKPESDVASVFSTIKRAALQGSAIISVDLPSGIDCDTCEAADYALRADATITFFSYKVGLIGYPGRKFAGEITVDNLGMPADIIKIAHVSSERIKAITLSEAKLRLPMREADGHKGTFGKVLLAGGSNGMAGAICMSAMSCLRMGSGLVYMLVPNEIRSMCLTAVPEALTYDISDKALISANAVLVGPGAANEDRMREIIKMQINGAEKLVLDAGALGIIADNRDMFRELLSTRRIDGKMLPIFTPHTGELDRLMPEHKLLDRTAKAQRASEYFNCILIHKGAGTVIASPEGDIWINTSGNSSMAKGGSGDILSGIIVSLLGQGLTPEDAAVLGTYFHGLCGDLSANEFGEISAIPTDMLTEIRKAYDLIRTENR